VNRFVLFLGLLALIACGDPPASDTKVIIGATLIRSPQPPIPYGIVIVKNDTIASVGTQQMTPVPPGSVNTEAYGKYLMHADGTLQAGAKANLVILSGDPAANPKIERRMTEGRWVE
jgi:imidazolonepropionase-like amidohydrolase